jgi:hypothetical protein
MAFRRATLRFQSNRIALTPSIKFRIIQMSAFASSAKGAGTDHASPPPPPLQQQPRSRPSQGQLVEKVMATPDFPNYPLIDISINLTDRSFDKVGIDTPPSIKRIRPEILNFPVTYYFLSFDLISGPRSSLREILPCWYTIAGHLWLLSTYNTRCTGAHFYFYNSAPSTAAVFSSSYS